jgi:hypothetical protein
MIRSVTHLINPTSTTELRYYARFPPRGEPDLKPFTINSGATPPASLWPLRSEEPQERDIFGGR